MSPSTKKYLTLAFIMLALGARNAVADKDLFKEDPAGKQDLPAQQMIDSSNEYNDIVEPTLSSSDAALLAQQHLGGKVMNVRQFQNENKTLYGVKVLQKNGRMTTINIDANNGSIVEE
jgi:uncharacterized membrane protein YkoI